jgi:hypothetical protein
MIQITLDGAAPAHLSIYPRRPDTDHLKGSRSGRRRRLRDRGPNHHLRQTDRSKPKKSPKKELDQNDFIGMWMDGCLAWVLPDCVLCRNCQG